MNFKKIVRIILLLLAGICFYVVYLMHSKLSFIDTPYLFGGIVLLLFGLLLFRKKK
ncbi:MAG: LPXTG cell wall anchor domain-containing protein [Flavobacteriales bacterium]